MGNLITKLWPVETAPVNFVPGADVEIIVEGQVFKCHKEVLVTFSPYLRKKLLSADGKSIANKVVVPKVGSREFGILLQYMYTHRLNMTCSDFYEIYEAASVLEIQDAMQECLQRLEDPNVIRSTFYIYVTAKKMADQTNWLRSLRFLTHRFEETVCTTEFLELDVDCILEILSAQIIGARSEVIVFLAALRWLNHDYANRHEHAAKVMECVRFSNMTMDEISACYNPPYLSQVMEKPEVHNLLFKATCCIIPNLLGQECGYENIGCPKRILTVQGLSMELWHPVQQEAGSKPSNLLQDFQKVPRKYTTNEENMNIPKEVKNFLERMTEIKNQKIRNEDEFGKPIHACHNTLPFTPQIIDAASDQAVFHKEQARVAQEFSKTPTKDKKECPIKDLPLSHSQVKHTEQTLNPSEDVAYITKSPVGGKMRGSSSINFSPLRKKNAQFANPLKTSDTDQLESPKSLSGFTPLGHKPKRTEIKELPRQSEIRITDSEESVHIRVEEDSGSSNIPLPSENSSGRWKQEKQPTILVVGGMNPNNPHTIGIGGAILNFDIKKNTWLRYSTLPHPRFSHSAAFVNNCLYVIGGCDPRDFLKQNRWVPSRSCYKLDIATQKWSILQDMEFKRYDHGLAVYFGFLYVIGGQDDGERLLKSVEVFDTTKNKWRMLPSELCCGRKSMGVTTCSGRIWIAGGLMQPEKEISSQVVNQIDCYDPKQKRWLYNVHSLPSARFSCSLTVWNNLICCVGGMVRDEKGKMIPSDEVWFFNIEAKLWDQGPSLPVPKMGSVALVYGSHLYVVGGFNPDADISIRNMNFLTNGATSWEIAAQLPSDAVGVAAVTSEMR